MMMKFKLKYAVIVALFMVAPAMAQTDEAEQTNPVILYSGTAKRYEIAEIQVTGIEANNTKSLIKLSGLSVGQRIAVPGPEVTEAMKRLWNTGLFANVKISALKTSGDRIWLEILIEQNPKVKEVIFHGVRNGESSDLEDKIGLFPGSQITQNGLNRSEKLVRDYFDEKGFKDAEVRVQQRSEPDEDGLVYVDVFIDKKDKVKVREIHIDGNVALTGKDIRKLMKKTNEKGNIREFFRTKKFVKDEFQNDMDNILTRYGELGYRDACIVRDSVSNNFDDNTVDVWLTIEEGDKYFLRNITWVGNTVYSTGQLDAVLNMKSGDVYNQKKLTERVSGDEDAIGKMYYNRGYVLFQLDPVEVNVTGDSIDLEMRIAEGPQATINRVGIIGNDRLYENVVRRALYTHTLDTFPNQEIESTYRQIDQMGHFEPTTINPDIKPDPSNGTVDINWELESKANDQVELSAGWGQTGVIGRLSLKFTNFSMYNLFHKSDNYRMFIPQGDGQTLSISGQTNGQFYHSYSISFLEPWLGGKRPNSLSVGLFYSKQTDISSNYYNSAYYQNMYQYMYGYGNYYGNGGYYNNYESYYDPDKYITMLGASIGWGKRLHWPDDYFTIYGELAYTRYKLKQWDYFLINNGTCNNINLGVTLSRNTTDNPIFPRVGSEFAASVYLTPPYSLFDGVDYEHLAADPTSARYQDELRQKHKWIEYNKWKFRSRTYTSLTQGAKRRLVLMTRFDFGLLGHYNKYKKSPFETFFVGGDGMSGGSYTYATEIVGLRGYDNGALTPYSDGYAYTRMAAELRFPLLMENSTTIYALAFLEGGNAWDSIGKFNPFDMKRSAGAGVRVFLSMIGLMGIDWAYGFDPIMGSRQYGGSQVHFILGQEF
ncbi:MAG: outer membrane protein assembly factor BamA [Bacteroidetes bacterium]|nr:outer membrane protein assembly factor BamA [Candidatus Colenecus caballi]